MPVANEADELNAADAAIGASAMRKVSLHLLPLIGLGYGAAYMDRVNINFAALQMNRDLHFSATTYGFGAGFFFLSYAACEVPSNLFLYRFGARRWLARIMLTWGVIAMAMLFVRTPAQFYTGRFLLGMAEAGFFPGVIFYLIQWFPPNLRARAVSRFYISLPLSSVSMGLIAGALLHLDGRLGLRGWQWLFLLEGLPPILLGLIYLYRLPDNPAQAPWLTPDERVWITRNVAQPPETHQPHATREALRDPRVWLLGFFMLLMLGSSYAYTFITPDLIQLSTGLGPARIGFLIAGLSLVGSIAMLLNAAHSDRRQERYFHVIPCALIVSAGFFLCSVSLRPIVIIPALALIIIAYSAMQGPLWAIPGSFFQGRTAAAGIATLNSIGILGGFLGPYYMGFAKDLTGSYLTGMRLMALPMLLGCAILLYLRHIANQRTALNTDATPSTSN